MSGELEFSGLRLDFSLCFSTRDLRAGDWDGQVDGGPCDVNTVTQQRQTHLNTERDQVGCSAIFHPQNG